MHYLSIYLAFVLLPVYNLNLNAIISAYLVMWAFVCSPCSVDACVAAHVAVLYHAPVREGGMKVMFDVT